MCSCQVHTIRRVVIIIEYKRAHRKLCDILSHRSFAFGRARKAQIQTIYVHIPTDNRFVAVPWTRYTAALRDGGTIKNYRFFVAISSCLFDVCLFVQTDPKLRNAAVQRKVDEDIFHTASRQILYSRISVLHIIWRYKGAIKHIINI